MYDEEEEEEESNEEGESEEEQDDGALTIQQTMTGYTHLLHTYSH